MSLFKIHQTTLDALNEQYEALRQTLEAAMKETFDRYVALGGEMKKGATPVKYLPLGEMIDRLESLYNEIEKLTEEKQGKV